MTLNLLEVAEVEAAKDALHSLFQDALQQIPVPDIDPGQYFWIRSTRIVCALPGGPALREPKALAWQLYEWLRLNHPQPGAFVSTGIYDNADYWVH